MIQRIEKLKGTIRMTQNDNLFSCGGIESLDSLWYSLLSFSADQILSPIIGHSLIGDTTLETHRFEGFNKINESLGVTN